MKRIVEFEKQYGGLDVYQRVIGSFGVNTYVVSCRQTKEACVIDAGGDSEIIRDWIESHGLTVRYLLCTHGHVDHVFGLGEMGDFYPEAKVAWHREEDIVVEHLAMQCRAFGMPLPRVKPRDIDLEVHEKLVLGSYEIESLWTPGHTPGHVCYYFDAEKLLFSGDLLFKGSVGRTDFEGGSGVSMQKSLEEIQQRFSDDVVVLSGHGRDTTMGEEKANNFYLKLRNWR